MKKIIILLSLAALAIMSVVPVLVTADDSKSITVYAPSSSRPVTEEDVLNYMASMYTSGYINDTYYTTQSTLYSRMNSLKELATKGFDLSSDDSFIWAVLLPNSATADNVTTWFGHPVVKSDDHVLIKGWFLNNIDADIVFLLTSDDRYKY